MLSEKAKMPKNVWKIPNNYRRGIGWKQDAAHTSHNSNITWGQFRFHPELPEFFLQIDVVADLPVGDNLQDHLFFFAFSYTLKEPVAITGEKLGSLTEFAKYMLLGQGRAPVF